MKKSNVIAIHLLFWAIIILFILSSMFFPRFLSVAEYGRIKIIQNIAMPLLMPASFYTGYFFIMPFLKKKKNIPYIIVLLLLISIIVSLISKPYFYLLVDFFYIFFQWGTFGSLFRFLFDWYKKREENLQLQKQNAESNLALLRMQVNPHFMFNTLNNIDALIKDNPQKASQSIIKLSDIMRYMTYDSQSDKVTMKQELAYIKEYVSLEELRWKNPEFVSFSIRGNYAGLSIAPMLFIPFIENAFKHAVDSDVSGGIIITFDFQYDTAIFVCENRYEPSAEKDETHGIGLEMVKKRLDLIYPKKYTLNIEDKNGRFKVEMRIKL